MPAAHPKVTALLTADSFHRDGMGKGYVLGIFDSVSAHSYPVRHPLLVVYLALTDGHGPTDLTLRLTDAAEEYVQTLGVFHLVFPNPVDVVEAPIPLRDLEFPHPGEYHLQVVCEDVILFERRMNATLIGGPGHEAPDVTA